MDPALGRFAVGRDRDFGSPREPRGLFQPKPTPSSPLRGIPESGGVPVRGKTPSRPSRRPGTSPTASAVPSPRRAGPDGGREGRTDGGRDGRTEGGRDRRTEGGGSRPRGGGGGGGTTSPVKPRRPPAAAGLYKGGMARAPQSEHLWPRWRRSCPVPRSPASPRGRLLHRQPWRHPQWGGTRGGTRTPTRTPTPGGGCGYGGGGWG